MKFDIPLLQSILDSAVESGEECGLQLAVYDHGELAFDLCSGYADRARTVKVTPETLFPVYSCGKGVMSAAFHILVERQIIRYNDRVADYWPEYGCNGKEETLVWQALSHRAAVSALPELADVRDRCNWELMCKKIAEAVPANTPGEKCAYHGVTFAWVIGELATRASGIFFRDFINEELLKRLGLERDFFFGTDAEADSRVAEVDGKESDWVREFIETPEIRHGFIPSANGIGTAGSLAKIYAAITTGVEGKKLLRDETVENATILRRHWSDPLTPTWAKFGLGWALPYAPDNYAVFGHGGALGGEGFADRERGITVGFVKNHVTSTHPVHPVRDRLAEAMGMPVRHW